MAKDILDIIDLQELGRELQRARKRKSMTQEEAAKLINVTRTTVVAIEKGERRIHEEELITLAYAYDRTVRDFMRQRPNAGKMDVQFRGPFVRTQNDDETVDPNIIEFEDLCRNYLELEILTNSPLTKKYPAQYDIANISPANREQRIEYIALEERNRLGLGDGPLPPLRALLENDVGLRIFYIRLANKFSEIYGYTEELGGCLSISSVHPEEKKRWSLAHGYFHFLTTRNQSLATQEDRANQLENERAADAFARFFLMPTSGITRRFGDIKKLTPASLFNLASYYSVSPIALIRRLEGLRLIPNGTWERLDGKVQWNELRQQLGNSAPSYYADKLPARYTYLAIEALQREFFSEGEFARFLGIDIMESRKVAEQLDQQLEDDASEVDARDEPI